MRLLILLFFFITLGSSRFHVDPVYTWTNGVDHMSLTMQENNQYKLIISSCVFQVKCEGQYRAYGDSLVIHTKKVKENRDRSGTDQWKKTAFCKRIDKSYLKNFKYVLVEDSSLLVNQLRWEYLVFKRKKQ